MVWLVYIGTALALLGCLGIVWCIAAILRARRTGLDDADLRARLNRLLPVNLGSFMVAALGLMMVVTGVLLA